jgi:carboxyl-terminal processing protease
MRRRAVLPGFFLGLLLLLSGSFASGYLASRADALDAPLASLEVLLDRFGLVDSARAATTRADVETLFKPFWEAWDLIGRDYYDESAIEPEKLYRGALKGMVSAVGDPYTLYMDPQIESFLRPSCAGRLKGSESRSRSPSSSCG